MHNHLSPKDWPLSKYNLNVQLDMVNQLDETGQLESFYRTLNSTFKLQEEKDETIPYFIEICKRLYREGPSEQSDALFASIAGTVAYKKHLSMNDVDYAFRLQCIVIAMDVTVKKFFGVSLLDDPEIGKVKISMWKVTDED